jgi:hypothetical protein
MNFDRRLRRAAQEAEGLFDSKPIPPMPERRASGPVVAVASGVIVLAVFGVVALLVSGDDSTPAVSTSPPMSFSPPGDSTTTTVETRRQLTIAMSGWVGHDARGSVVCPYEFTEACPGIPVSGGDLPPVGDPVRVTGIYDGVSLQVETAELWAPYEPPVERGELFNPCTGGLGPGTGGQSPEIQSRVEDALAGDENRLAGMWLADGQLVVALTGPDDEVAERVREAHHRVCVDTGYPRSQEEIMALTSEISRTLIVDEDVWILDSWDSVVDGPIRIRSEAIDTPTLNTFADLYGDALDLTAYIEVIDAPLADLPAQQPPVPADTTIPIAGVRGHVPVTGTLNLVLTLDVDQNCLYADRGDERRWVVVWPFGYSAVSGDPTIVYDPAGNEVARTGVPVDLDGSGVEIDHIDPAQRCDADRAWQNGGPTRYEIETVWPQLLDLEDE